MDGHDCHTLASQTFCWHLGAPQGAGAPEGDACRAQDVPLGTPQSTGGQGLRTRAIVGGLLDEGELMLVCGPSRSGKSTLLAKLALARAAGRSWLGRPCERGPVAYLDLSTCDAVVRARLSKASREMRLGARDLGGRLHATSLKGHALNSRELATALDAALPKDGGRLVVLDALLPSVRHKGTLVVVCNLARSLMCMLRCAVVYPLGVCASRLDTLGVFSPSRDPDVICDLHPAGPLRTQVSLTRGNDLIHEFEDLGPQAAQAPRPDGHPLWRVRRGRP